MRAKQEPMRWSHPKACLKTKGGKSMISALTEQSASSSSSYNPATGIARQEVAIPLTRLVNKLLLPPSPPPPRAPRLYGAYFLY